MMEPAKGVFLSYASQDAEAARRLCEALKAAGIDAWFDQSELRGGDAWDQKIRRQIRDCALFIPVISSNTVARREGYFRLEWNLADQRTHMMSRNKAFIVPVCIDATSDAGADVPESFARAQWTRLPGGETPPEFVAQVARLLATGEPAPLSSGQYEAPAPPAAPAKKKRPVARFIGLAFFILFLLTTGRVHFNIGGSSAKFETVAVLPFENLTGDKSMDPLGDGLSDGLISRLTALEGLRVISRSSSFKFRDRKMDAAEIGRELEVEAVVMGTVAKRGDVLEVTAELVLADDGIRLWGERYSRGASELVDLESEIATSIAGQLRKAHP